MSSGQSVVLGLVLCVLACGVVSADVRLPSIIGDNMVIQQEANAPIWGWAAPGEKVTVSIAGQSVSATADSAGKWMVRLSPLPAGGPHEMTVAGQSTIVVKNILVGEVWLCSGQSNMKHSVSGCNGGKQAAEEANYPSIRLFQARMWAWREPLDDNPGKWVECSPTTVRGFSGVGYFFGRRLYEDLKVPMGLIDSTSGGTAAQAWISAAGMQGDEELKAMAAQSAQGAPAFYERMEKYEQDFARWKVEANQARAAHQRTPTMPATPFRGWGYPISSHYNGQIAPLVPFAIRGVIWYQGEANANFPRNYAKLLAALIADWRARWGQGDFPFLIVQLPNLILDYKNWPVRGWAGIREQQIKTVQTVPNTGLAVTFDVGDANDLHPRNKIPVGERLALAAEGIAYGKKITYSGPVFESMSKEGNRLRLRFRFADDGLTMLARPATTGPSSQPAAELKGFQVAGSDRKFVPAEARIDGSTVVVSSPQVADPAAVRYAFEDNPDGNLFNKAKLPASPFRTDDWDLAQPEKTSP